MQTDRSTQQYLRERTLSVTGGSVFAGPFRGMRYVERSFGSAFLPKLLGSYERELQPIVELACRGTAARVVNVGSAEGYYAVGMAYRRPATPVVAFETDPEARRACERLSAMNGLAAVVAVRGACDHDTLEDAVRVPDTLVICDCEGGEDELLCPRRVPSLCGARVLVETHDFLRPGVTDALRARFLTTHRCHEIWQSPRTRSDFPFRDERIDRVPDEDLIALLDEQRPQRMRWLWLEPFRRPTDQAP